jgi:hypothetical protein
MIATLNVVAYSVYAVAIRTMSKDRLFMSLVALVRSIFWFGGLVK